MLTPHAHISLKTPPALVPSSFTNDLVLGQLRCCGVLEVARVSRAGFPTRYPHAAFVERYRVMLPKVGPAACTVFLAANSYVSVFVCASHCACCPAG